MINTSIATLVAVMSLGGPTAAGWVALIGTTGDERAAWGGAWYGTLANHAGLSYRRSWAASSCGMFQPR